MVRGMVMIFAVAASLQQAVAAGQAALPSGRSGLGRPQPYRVAQARSCKAVSTCEEAVQLWCSGYSRADGDHDGIPCETVCDTKEQVDEIKAKIGC